MGEKILSNFIVGNITTQIITSHNEKITAYTLPTVNGSESQKFNLRILAHAEGLEWGFLEALCKFKVLVTWHIWII